jgi:hypothetical protein
MFIGNNLTAQKNGFVGISPIGYNNAFSAHVGFKENQFAIYIGIQSVNLNISYSEFGEEKLISPKDSAANTVESNYFESEIFSGNFTVLSIGSKFFFKPEHKTNPYISGKILGLLVNKDYIQKNTTTIALENRLINGNKIGGEIGFGAEYFFNEYISISGEFGYRLLSLMHNKKRQSIYYPEEMYHYKQENLGDDLMYKRVVFTSKINNQIIPFYSTLSLIFYF